MSTKAIQSAGAGLIVPGAAASYEVRSTYAEGSNPRTLARVIGSNGTVLLAADFTQWDVRVFHLTTENVAIPAYNLLAQAPGSAIQAIGTFTGEWTYDTEGGTFFHTLDLQANQQLAFRGGSSILMAYTLYSNQWGRIMLTHRVAFEASLGV